jgi:hypothetical protein
MKTSKEQTEALKWITDQVNRSGAKLMAVLKLNHDCATDTTQRRNEQSAQGN